MSAYDGQPQPIRQGSGGALTGRRVEAAPAAECPRAAGPRRAPGTDPAERSVYGATPIGPYGFAEAPHQGAGSQMWRGETVRTDRPHGSAAGGIAERIVNRRCGSRFDRRRWSR